MPPVGCLLIFAVPEDGGRVERFQVGQSALIFTGSPWTTCRTANSTSFPLSVRGRSARQITGTCRGVVLSPGWWCESVDATRRPMPVPRGASQTERCAHRLPFTLPNSQTFKYNRNFFDLSVDFRSANAHTPGFRTASERPWMIIPCCPFMDDELAIVPMRPAGLGKREKGVMEFATVRIYSSRSASTETDFGRRVPLFLLARGTRFIIKASRPALQFAPATPVTGDS